MLKVVLSMIGAALLLAGCAGPSTNGAGPKNVKVGGDIRIQGTYRSNMP